MSAIKNENLVAIPRKPQITDKELSNYPFLMTVPVYFYIEFFKMYQKQILYYIIAVTVFILGLVYLPNYNSRRLANDYALKQYESKVSDMAYIQSYNPLIYEEMLKSLQRMQQTTFNLLAKQHLNERKTLALQHQIKTLKNSHCEIAGIKHMIKDALAVYDADKLGLRDYALESLGGRIVSTPETKAKLSHTQYVLFGFIPIQTYSNPRLIINADVMPGNCFAFEGQHGKIRIKLSNKIFITAVTLEHASKSLLTNDEITSAPQDFRLYGLQNEYDENGIILGFFTYNINNGSQRQTFLISMQSDLKNNKYEFIEIHILNNYGQTDYTCVYRLRVHGTIVTDETK